jgi:hypothetical membrane protein
MFAAILTIANTIIFIFIIGISIVKWGEFSISKLSISELGTKRAPYPLAFKFGMILLGLTTIMFSGLLKDYLPTIWLTNMVVFLFILSGLFTVVIGLIPFDKHRNTHLVFATTAFIFVIVISLALIPVNRATAWMWGWAIIFSIASVLTALVLTYNSIKSLMFGWNKWVWRSEWALFLLALATVLILALMIVAEIAKQGV